MVLVTNGTEKIRVADILYEDYARRGYTICNEDVSFVAEPIKETATAETVETETAETNTFKCPYCGKTYKGEAYLNRHLAKVHGERNA